jgi:hypothetical protein
MASSHLAYSTRSAGAACPKIEAPQVIADGPHRARAHAGRRNACPIELLLQSGRHADALRRRVLQHRVGGGIDDFLAGIDDDARRLEQRTRPCVTADMPRLCQLNLLWMPVARPNNCPARLPSTALPPVTTVTATATTISSTCPSMPQLWLCCGWAGGSAKCRRWRGWDRRRDTSSCCC